MGWTAALVALFFAPLSVIYGRHVARRIYAGTGPTGRSLAAASARRLAAPLVLLAGMIVAVEGRPAVLGHLPSWLADNGGVLLIVWLVDRLGQLGLILFFLAVPYGMGSVFGVAAVLFGYVRRVPDGPVAPAAQE